MCFFLFFLCKITNFFNNIFFMKFLNLDISHKYSSHLSSHPPKIILFSVKVNACKIKATHSRVLLSQMDVLCQRRFSLPTVLALNSVDNVHFVRIFSLIFWIFQSAKPNRRSASARQLFYKWNKRNFNFQHKCTRWSDCPDFWNVKQLSELSFIWHGLRRSKSTRNYSTIIFS